MFAEADAEASAWVPHKAHSAYVFYNGKALSCALEVCKVLPESNPITKQKFERRCSLYPTHMLFASGSVWKY